MRPDYALIYSHDAPRYDELVSYEDYKNGLLDAINLLFPLKASHEAADIGSGTGRISFLLSPYIGKIHAFEPNDSMRGVAIDKKERLGIANIDFLRGGYGDIRLPDKSVDIVIEGWSLGYFYQLSQPSWKGVIESALCECRRVLKPAGVIILIETLGTMEESPISIDALLPLYGYLESSGRFRCLQIRTDYKFPTVEKAVDLTTFFFGEEIGNRVRKRNSPIVPECTGLWYTMEST
jgi:ubiquinone/menaquinone biosynthesis C-methylase UbiE